MAVSFHHDVGGLEASDRQSLTLFRIAQEAMSNVERHAAARRVEVELVRREEGVRLRVVDDVFVEESLERKRHYIVEYGADILVMGDDWEGKFDWVSDVCEVIYLPRTPSVSTTGLIEHIASLGS